MPNYYGDILATIANKRGVSELCVIQQYLRDKYPGMPLEALERRTKDIYNEYIFGELMPSGLKDWLAIHFLNT